jgi:iron complex transport system substrate-binding protein
MNQFIDLSLCILLSILPAVAYDFTLTIFGNANMDDTIDESDIEFVREIISGTQKATAFSDANYDGMIDERDISKVESIMKGNKTNLTIVDGVGRNLTVSVPVEKIVTLAGSYGPEMLLAFGIQPEAITEQSKSHAVQLQDIMENIPTVGTYQEPDIEAIMKLKPQLVHCYESRYNKAGSYEKLEMNLKDIGINLVALDFHNPRSFNNAIRIMGYLLGDQPRADSLIDFEESNMNLIKERTKELTYEQRTPVYLESSKDLATRGPGDATYESIILCGGRSIFDDIVDPYPTVESEAVIERNPQVIIKVPDGLAATDSAEPLESLLDSIANRTGWEGLDAVKNNRIYVVNGGTKSVHNSIFCLFSAKALHPDLFKDVDPESIYLQWYKEFLGLDNDLLVVYPPSESWK